MRKAEIKFNIQLDENNLPETISWEASDTEEQSPSKAILLSIWDDEQKSTLRIDLWTKDMLVDDMKRFFHQQLVSMADTLERATSEEDLAADLRSFADHFGLRTGILEEKKS